MCDGPIFWIMLIFILTAYITIMLFVLDMRSRQMHPAPNNKCKVMCAP